MYVARAKDPSLYGGSTPPLPPFPGARGLKRLELDLKRYDLQRLDFEEISTEFGLKSKRKFDVFSKIVACADATCTQDVNL